MMHQVPSLLLRYSHNWGNYVFRSLRTLRNILPWLLWSNWLSGILTHIFFHEFKRTNVFFCKMTSSSPHKCLHSQAWWENSLETKERLVMLSVCGFFFFCYLIYEVLWVNKLKSSVLVFHILLISKRIYFISKFVI